MKLFYCSHCDQIFRSHKKYALHINMLYDSISKREDSYKKSLIFDNQTFIKKIVDYNRPTILDSSDCI